MLQCPVGSSYPGKYVMFAFAAFFAALCWRTWLGPTERELGGRSRDGRGLSDNPPPFQSATAPRLTMA